MAEPSVLTLLTLPVVSTEAILLSDDDHTPCTVASLSCVVDPAHILVVPVIVATTGNAIIVMGCVTVVWQPDVLLTV